MRASLSTVFKKLVLGRVHAGLKLWISRTNGTDFIQGRIMEATKHLLQTSLLRIYISMMYWRELKFCQARIA
ncbi:hypothetical protein J2Z17_003963 [Rhizobium halophytocola]|uniref:Transposase DDE domain-containing protein n=1 Tax=Rhizobium halophytocola TaxID=735519 RepID=A0ABS4E3I8_9HYPH|nr:hypothetical protein [Rhizobium halophytocola]